MWFGQVSRRPTHISPLCPLLLLICTPNRPRRLAQVARLLAAAAVVVAAVAAPPAEVSSEVEAAEAAAASAMASRVPPSFVAWPHVPCPRPWSPGRYCREPVKTDWSKMNSVFQISWFHGKKACQISSCITNNHQLIRDDRAAQLSSCFFFLRGVSSSFLSWSLFFSCAQMG